MADIPFEKEEKQVDTVPVPGAVTETVTKKEVPSNEGPKARQIELILPKAGNVEQVKVEILAMINTHVVQLLDEQRKTNKLLEKMLEANI